MHQALAKADTRPNCPPITRRTSVLNPPNGREPAQSSISVRRVRPAPTHTTSQPGKQLRTKSPIFGLDGEISANPIPNHDQQGGFSRCGSPAIGLHLDDLGRRGRISNHAVTVRHGGGLLPPCPLKYIKCTDAMSYNFQGQRSSQKDGMRSRFVILVGVAIAAVAVVFAVKSLILSSDTATAPTPLP